MSRRFHKAIVALENEKLKIVGKAVMEYNERGHPELAGKTLSVLNIVEAIKILTDHPRNTNI